MSVTNYVKKNIVLFFNLVSVKSIILGLFLFMSSINFAHSFPFNCDGVHTGEYDSNGNEIVIFDLFAENFENQSGMTKEKFISLIDKVVDVVQPIFSKYNAKLTVNKRWDDNATDANSSQWANGNWRVSMYGGLARHKLITDDGLMMVLCHEVGHHIGGAPKKFDVKNNIPAWSSAEGQADYFASLKCFRMVIENDDNISIVKSMKIDPVVVQNCNQIYKTEAEIAMCQRSAMASYSVSNYIASRTAFPVINFGTPSSKKVGRTEEGHPEEPQCRLDSYFQGALCDKPILEEVSNDNTSIGTCTKNQGFSIGLRPGCWYKAGTQDL